MNETKINTLKAAILKRYGGAETKKNIHLELRKKWGPVWHEDGEYKEMADYLMQLALSAPAYICLTEEEQKELEAWIIDYFDECD